MKRIISATLVACLSFVLSGALIGCHASADVDPDRDSHSNSSVKRTTVRDANGHVVREETHKSTTENP